MTDLTKISPLSAKNSPGRTRRYRAERRFQFMGRMAIAMSLGFLMFLILSIAYLGAGAFFKTEIRFDLDPALSDGMTDDSYSLLRRIVLSEPGISGRGARKAYFQLIGADAEDVVRAQITDHPLALKTSLWLPASDEVDMAVKAGLDQNGISRLSPQQLDWVRMLVREGRVKTRFNTGFLLNGDSRDAERAGVGGALLGSLFTLVICFLLSFFVGVMAAIYLEEFAPKNKWTAFLEVNINNLASVPSIIFGLLGLALFLNIFGLPRSSSLVGGMVLALMTLPIIIIASRVSLQSVPPSVREAALGLGATRVQMVFHHVVPLALPGMLTGAILGMARALGETAPLMMIGMVAFIADPPGNFTDPAATMPVQIYLWSDSPERAFAEKVAGAIIVLILFLILMNLSAVLLRRKFEKKW